MTMRGRQKPVDPPLLWLVDDGIEIYWPSVSSPDGKASWRLFACEKDKVNFYSHSFDPSIKQGPCEVEWDNNGVIYKTLWRPAKLTKYSRRRRQRVDYSDTRSRKRMKKARNKNSPEQKKQSKGDEAEGEDISVRSENNEARVRTGGNDVSSSYPDGGNPRRASTTLSTQDIPDPASYSVKEIAASAALTALQNVSATETSAISQDQEAWMSNDGDGSGANSVTLGNTRGLVASAATELSRTTEDSGRESRDILQPRVSTSAETIETPEATTNAAGTVGNQSHSRKMAERNDDAESSKSAGSDDDDDNIVRREMTAAKFPSKFAAYMAHSKAQTSKQEEPNARKVIGNMSRASDDNVQVLTNVQQPERTSKVQRTAKIASVNKTARDNEDQALYDNIHQIIFENRRLWNICEPGMKERPKLTHPQYIRTIHTGDEPEEDGSDEDDDRCKGYMDFERRYVQVKIIYKEDNRLLLEIEDSEPITVMLSGLAKHVPAQFQEFISAKEETSEGFILDYSIARSIWKRLGDGERVDFLKQFQRHLISIGSSLMEVDRWLREPDEWNNFVMSMLQKYATFVDSGSWKITAANAAELEKALTQRRPRELVKVLTREYDLS